MRLLFEHGTLVLSDPPDVALDFVPGMRWDGRVGLWRAPAWRYTQILAAFERRGLPLDDASHVAGLPAAGPWLEIPLRPYQQTALIAWELSGRRGTVVLPTGSGKTRVALAAMASTATRALCLVPTRALLRQWIAELEIVVAGPVGCLGDGEQVLEPVTVATFESAYRRMPYIGNRFDLLVVDEVHHFGGSIRDEALEMCVAAKRLGLTATPPVGPALDRISELVGPVVHRLAVRDLAGTWLSRFDTVVLRLGLEPDEAERYAVDSARFTEVHRLFRREQPNGTWQEFVRAASVSAEGRAALAAWRRARQLVQFTRSKARAVRHLLARHRGSRVLVFTADNDAAYAIAREHLVMPITCDIPRDEREWALEAFRSGELGALVSARVLNEGIDVPDADVAIIVAGTFGEREHVQRVGRLLRPAPGKRATVYELVTIATSEARQAAERRRGLVA
jgi:superfamily II DNA or RNA helicase